MSIKCSRDRRRALTNLGLCLSGGVPTDRSRSCATCEFPLVVINGFVWINPRDSQPRCDVGLVGELTVEFGNAGKNVQQCYMSRYVRVAHRCGRVFSALTKDAADWP